MNHPSRTLTSLVACALVLVTPVVARAQDDGPRRAAEEYLAALKTQDFLSAATLTHPDALAEMRDFLERLSAFDDTGEFLSLLYGGRAGEFEQLSDAEAFAGFLRFALTQDQMASEMMGSMEQQILGQVVEGDTVHVVARMSVEVEGIPVRLMEVSSFLQHEGLWLALLSGEIAGVVAAMESMLQSGG